MDALEGGTRLDKTQAEAIARAMMEPQIQAQQAARQKHLAQASGRTKRQKIGWFVLGAGLIGGAVGMVTGHRFFDGAIWGAPIGALVGWLVLTWSSATK